MNKDLDKKFKIIVDELKVNYREKLSAVLLYGSFSSGKVNLKSDIDIAIILNNYDSDDCYSVYTIMEELGCFLQKKVDLVLFNETSIILKMQIIKNHKLLYCEKKNIYIQEIVKGLSQYNDLKICRTEIEKNIAKGTIYAR